MITAIIPIEIDILEPIINLLNKSLPYLSVPMKNIYSLNKFFLFLL